MTVSTLHIVGNDHSLLDPSTWAGGAVQSISDPDTPEGVLHVLAAVPAVAETLGEHLVAARSAEEAIEAGSVEAATYSAALTAHEIAVRAGATRIPKRPSEDEAVIRLVALWRVHEIATTTTRRTSRAVDAAAVAAASLGRSGALAAARAKAVAAREAVTVAEGAVADAREAFSTVQALDVMELRASGIAPVDAAQIVGDRTDRLASHHLAATLRDRVPTPELLDTITEPALQAHTAATRAAEVQRQARTRHVEILPIPGGTK